MYPYLGDFPTGETIYIPFHTFDSNDPSASVTLTGLALADIKVYKDGSVTQRSSTAGFALLDTDGIDFDSITGIHGISIDTSDNTDAGFYAAGSDYWVVINSVTVDAATINFIAATFSIDNRGLLRPTTAQRTLDVTTGGEAGIDFANTNGTIDAAQLGADCITAAKIADNAFVAANFAASSLNGKGDWNVGKTGYTVSTVSDKTGYSLAADQSGVTIGTVTTNTDMRGTDSAALASVCTESRLAELDAANLPADVDTLKGGIITGSTTGTPTTTSTNTDLTGYADSELVGATIVFTGGTADGQRATITSYASTNGVVGFAALTTAPAASDTFKIV